MYYVQFCFVYLVAIFQNELVKTIYQHCFSNIYNLILFHRTLYKEIHLLTFRGIHQAFGYYI